MECKSGVQGIKELAEEGTPVEILEGDYDYIGSCQVGLECNFEKAV